MLGIFFQIFLKNHKFWRFLLKNMESFLEIFEARRHPNEIGKQRPRSLQKCSKTKNIDLRFLHFLFIFDDFCRYLPTRSPALSWAISAQFSHFWTRNLWFWVRSKHKLFVFFWFSESLIFMLCFCKIHDFAFIINVEWTENSTLFLVFNQFPKTKKRSFWGSKSPRFWGTPKPCFFPPILVEEGSWVSYSFSAQKYLNLFTFSRFLCQYFLESMCFLLENE